MATLEERFAALEDSNLAVADEVRALGDAIGDVTALRLAERRTRRWIRYLAVGGVVLVTLVALLLLHRVNVLLDRQAVGTLSTCEQRNASTARVRAAMGQQVRQERDPVARRVFQVLARELGATPTDCTAIKGR